jgi:hypothetical protein
MPTPFHKKTLAFFAFFAVQLSAASAQIALYDFSTPDGDLILDKSGVGEPLNLKITNPAAVTRSAGSLTITGDTQIRSEQPAKKIRDAVVRSNELSIEAWLQIGKPNQTGPARIVTISKDGSNRNATLGQDGDNFDIRLRTTKTSDNGIPSITAKLSSKLTHIVYTRTRSGTARIWINGKETTKQKVEGNLNNWNGNYHLALGNEFSNDRLWLGTYHLVAIYARALSPEEIASNFDTHTVSKKPLTSQNTQLFTEHIAPLFAKHCLECHDTANHKGKLDLSLRETALASKSIVPKNSADSELWQAVHEDEMPEDRTPLNPEEKAILKKWIDDGAHWPEAIAEIDPLAHKRDTRAAQNWIRRLTLPEYIATVQATVGVDISKEAIELLPKDLRADGFSNTAYNLGVDLKHIESYAKLAEIIVSKMKPGDFAKRFSKENKFTDDSMKELLEPMGKWILRGPFEEQDLIAYRGISTTVASAGGTHDEAVSLIIEAMLQSPRFIYQIENHHGDGTRWPVSEYELASRMSYIIWGASPDEALTKSADSGALTNPDECAKQIDRMLKDPRAIDRSLQFISDWLNLNRLNNLAPNKDKFPNWDPALAADMRAETLAFFKDIVWTQNRPLTDLLNAQQSHLTPKLAKHYGIKSSVGVPPALTDLTNISHRGGILTHGSLLTMGGDDASMVTRGLFVLHDLLRSGVKDPPPGTDTTPVPSKPGLSQRMIAEIRVADKSCGGCHSKFEPLSYGLERYDGLGGYSEIDRHGNKLREDGQIIFPGQSQPVPYKTAAELMDLLAKSDRVKETLTWKLTQFALGRPLTESDAKLLKTIEGETYQQILKSIIQSDLVQTTKTEIVD